MQAASRQIEFQQAPHFGFIFDDQDCGHRVRKLEAFSAFAEVAAVGKNSKAGAFSRLAFRANRAVMLVHDFRNDGQSYPHSGFFGGYEWIENVLALFGGNSRARVSNFTSTPAMSLCSAQETCRCNTPPEGPIASYAF